MFASLAVVDVVQRRVDPGDMTVGVDAHVVVVLGHRERVGELLEHAA